MTTPATDPSAAGFGRGPGLFGPGRRTRISEEGARGALIAFISTVVVLGGVLALILTSDAWPDVQRQFFSWFHFREAWPSIVSGFWLDVRMFLVAEVLILTISLGIAMIRALRGPPPYPH